MPHFDHTFVTEIGEGIRELESWKTMLAAGGSQRLTFSSIRIPGQLQKVKIRVKRQTCPLDLQSHSTNLCPLHRRLDAAMGQVEAAFGNTTLAEVLNESG